MGKLIFSFMLLFAFYGCDYQDDNYYKEKWQTIFNIHNSDLNQPGPNAIIGLCAGYDILPSDINGIMFYDNILHSTINGHVINYLGVFWGRNVFDVTVSINGFNVPVYNITNQLFYIKISDILAVIPGNTFIINATITDLSGTKTVYISSLITYL